MSADLKIEVAGKVNNNGVGFEKGIEVSFTSSRDWTEESSESETVSFTLEDGDLTDFFSVDVYPSLLGWGPVFKKQAGGQTSCPYEDEELSLYYEPGSVFKVVTAAIALSTGAVTLEDTIDCEMGEYKVAGRILHDHRPHGVLRFREVVSLSSNIGIRTQPI